MKQLLAITCLSLAFARVLFSAEAASTEEQQLLAMVKEIQTQQAQIADNQAKIEAKLTTIAEAVRVARIYSSRAGH
jgi:hypothetical protein